LESERQVTTAEGMEKAKKYRIPFYETSAKTRTNVEEAIFDLVRTIPRTGVQYKLIIVGDGGVGFDLWVFGFFFLTCFFVFEIDTTCCFRVPACPKAC
jgi:GTPase SAR1 family protein